LRRGAGFLREAAPEASMVRPRPNCPPSASDPEPIISLEACIAGPSPALLISVQEPFFFFLWRPSSSHANAVRAPELQVALLIYRFPFVCFARPNSPPGSGFFSGCGNAGSLSPSWGRFCFSIGMGRFCCFFKTRPEQTAPSDHHFGNHQPPNLFFAAAGGRLIIAKVPDFLVSPREIFLFGCLIKPRFSAQ